MSDTTAERTSAAPRARTRGASTQPVKKPSRAKAAFRSVLFWLHLAAGVFAGVVILVMSVTGAALTYQRQLMEREAAAYRASPAPGAERLPLDTLLARVRAADPERQPMSVSVKADPAAPVTVGFENRRTGYVDPYTGAVVTEQSRLRGFFTLMERWHRSMATGEGLRDERGVKITGAANLAFFFLVLSGMYLWLPRRWKRQNLKPILVFDPKAKGKARDWNWHHVIGIWSLPVLFVVVGSAVFISYQWPMKLVNTLAGVPAEPARGEGRGGGAPKGEPRRGEGGPRGENRGGGERGGAGRGEASKAPVISLDALWPAAERQVRGWTTIQARFPREAKDPVTFTISRGSGYRPDQRATLTLDAKTGAVKEFRRYADQEGTRRFRSWIRPLHTGEAFGVVGQTVAGIASLGGAVLVWTGIALALRRLRAWIGRRRRGERVPAAS